MSGRFVAEPLLMRALREGRRRTSDRRRLSELMAELTMVEERERPRVASCLHDQVGQPLAMATSKLGELWDAALSHDGASALEEVREMVAQALAASRSLTYELSSPALAELGLESALAELAERFEKRHALRIRLASEPRPKPVSDSTAAILYRAVRELLHNVVKHARATHVNVSVTRAWGKIWIRVEDDGVGFDAEAVRFDENGGFGLFSIREQLTHLGGRFDLRSSPSRGARAILSAPLADEDAAAPGGRR